MTAGLTMPVGVLNTTQTVHCGLRTRLISALGRPQQNHYGRTSIPEPNFNPVIRTTLPKNGKRPSLQEGAWEERIVHCKPAPINRWAGVRANYSILVVDIASLSAHTRFLFLDDTYGRSGRLLPALSVLLIARAF